MTTEVRNPSAAELEAQFVCGCLSTNGWRKLSIEYCTSEQLHLNALGTSSGRLESSPSEANFAVITAFSFLGEPLMTIFSGPASDSRDNRHVSEINCDGEQHMHLCELIGAKRGTPFVSWGKIPSWRWKYIGSGTHCGGSSALMYPDGLIDLVPENDPFRSTLEEHERLARAYHESRRR